MRIALAAWTALTLFLASTAPAQTLIVNGSGELTGATGVDVGGTLYDVIFVDASCVSAFNGCTSVTDFDFQSPVTAALAAQALLDQVFLDVLSGSFDTDPTLTLGCEFPPQCNVAIPYLIGGQGVFAAAALNSFDSSVDAVGGSIFSPSDDFGSGLWVWARFTPSATAVPESSTWALMLLGFGFVGFALRRRRELGQLA